MTQITITGSAGPIALPEAGFDKYSCWEEALGKRVEMISGRIVWEIRGHVWKASYSCDYLDGALWRRLAAVLRSGRSFTASVLPDDRDGPVTGEFMCESLTNPTFAFSKDGKALWHNIAFTLREVEPHD